MLGEALVELAKKPDPRIVLEVALVRLCRPDADRSYDAILERLERLERGAAAAPRSPAAAPSLPAADLRRRRRPARPRPPRDELAKGHRPAGPRRR